MTQLPIHQKKQYLLMVNEEQMAKLSQVFGVLSFIQVEGISLTDNPNYQAIVTPYQKPAHTIQDHILDAAKMVEGMPETICDC